MPCSSISSRILITREFKTTVIGSYVKLMMTFCFLLIPDTRQRSSESFLRICWYSSTCNILMHPMDKAVSMITWYCNYCSSQEMEKSPNNGWLWCPHPALEPLPLSEGECVGLSDDRNHIDLVVNGLHELDVKWFQAGREKETEGQRETKNLRVQRTFTVMT